MAAVIVAAQRSVPPHLSRPDSRTLAHRVPSMDERPRPHPTSITRPDHSRTDATVPGRAAPTHSRSKPPITNNARTAMRTAANDGIPGTSSCQTSSHLCKQLELQPPVDRGALLLASEHAVSRRPIQPYGDETKNAVYLGLRKEQECKAVHRYFFACRLSSDDSSPHGRLMAMVSDENLVNLRGSGNKRASGVDSQPSALTCRPRKAATSAR